MIWVKTITVFTAFLTLTTSSLVADEAAPAELWKSPVIIGASVSDGYDRSEPIGGEKSEKLSLEHYLDKIITAPHGKITNFGNKFFFMRPSGVSSKQVENASKLRPSVVLAPDFLFWLVYGNTNNEAERLRSLNRGLQLLEGFECPLVLGNIPDASKAIYKMLAPSQVPKIETMLAANKRILEWVNARKNVIILDNASFMKNSHANAEIKLKHTIIPKGKTSKLLQSDFLHPTENGARAVCCALLESLQFHTKFPDTDVNWKAR